MENDLKQAYRDMQKADFEEKSRLVYVGLKKEQSRLVDDMLKAEVLAHQEVRRVLTKNKKSGKLKGETTGIRPEFVESPAQAGSPLHKAMVASAEANFQDLMTFIREAEEWVNSVLDDKAWKVKGGKTVRFQYDVTGQNRAAAQRGYAKTNLRPATKAKILIGDKVTQRTIIHEIGHHIEFAVTEMDAPSSIGTRFRDYRVRKTMHSADIEPYMGYSRVAKAQQLNERLEGTNYKDDEVGWRDDFDKAMGSVRRAYYAGKDYSGLGRGGANSSEIISMGLEKLKSDPLDFVDKDPEWFKFMVGVLDGTFK
jgi:hypothetical protein